MVYDVYMVYMYSLHMCVYLYECIYIFLFLYLIPYTLLSLIILTPPLTLYRQGAGERDEKADEAALKEKKAKAGVSLFDSKRVQGIVYNVY